MYEVFLGGYSTLKNACDFYVHQVSCKCVKKHSIFAKYSFFELPKKNTSCKLFCNIYGSFCDSILFSIRNFNLRNLKDNGYTANDA